MKLSACFALLITLLQYSCSYQPNNSEDQKTGSNFVPPLNTERMRLFDADWRFYRGELSGAEVPDFDDSSWRKLDLPHDWSIEDLPNQKESEIVGPFDKSSIGTFYTGFVIGGIGWYRKSFDIEAEDQKKVLSIYFDGVYMESDIWLNGHLLGTHKHGYTPFYLQLNEYLNPTGEKNVLAVRVKNIGENSRWYSGSGIYRHVWLRATEPLNIPVWGVFVTTPEVSEEKAKVLASVTVENGEADELKFTLKNTVIGADGKAVAVSEKSEMLKSGETLKFDQTIEVSNPELWSDVSPALYTLKSELITDGKIIDSEETVFGIRSISFSSDKGFLLNGKSVLLSGACIHHDNGPLGAVAVDRADQRKIAILKANGFNAIRTSHNPPSQGFLDACDRQGILVMDEAFDMWENPKRPDDYHQFFREWHERDLQAMVFRDRNHPSVIFWSIGNEIKERADSSGLRITKDLVRIIKEIDQTRPVTEGICEFWETPGRKWQESAPAFALLDFCGYNYTYYEYKKDHETYPERVIAGTESYAMSIYEYWKLNNEKPYVVGDFVWTGMDYIGETGIGQVMPDSVAMCWPWIISNCGDIDLIGYKKPQSFYRDVVWDRSPIEMEVEEIAPEGKKWVIRDWGWKKTNQSWNWPANEGKSMNVFVYSKSNEVRLELNGKVIETQKSKPDSKFTFTFSVPYEPGELKAVALSGSNAVAEKTLKTTGRVEQIKMTLDRPVITSDRNDLAYVTVELVDANGRRVPDADSNIQFTVDGDAELAAVGNGNPMEPKSFQTNTCTSFQGRCLVILRPNGKSGMVSLMARCESIVSEPCLVEIQ
jgi:beta-galactosidase